MDKTEISNTNNLRQATWETALNQENLECHKTYWSSSENKASGETRILKNTSN